MSRSQPNPRILGIETSTLQCEVALAEGSNVVAVARIPEDAKASSQLVPVIQGLCRERGWSLRELDLVAVDIGPGSYTGLRVGLTCAKLLAFAAEAPLVTAGSLDTVALNLAGHGRTIEIAYDAARGQVFAAKVNPTDDRPCPLSAVSPRVIGAEQWATELDRTAIVTGPALAKYRALVPAGCDIADEPDWWPGAARVIELGLRVQTATPLASYWAIEPLYLRPSAAEEKRIAP